MGRRPFACLWTSPCPSWTAAPAPRGVSTERAALAPQMETALNANWDAA